MKKLLPYESISTIVPKSSDMFFETLRFHPDFLLENVSRSKDPILFSVERILESGMA